MDDYKVPRFIAILLAGVIGGIIFCLLFHLKGYDTLSKVATVYALIFVLIGFYILKREWPDKATFGKLFAYFVIELVFPALVLSLLLWVKL